MKHVRITVALVLLLKLVTAFAQNWITDPRNGCKFYNPMPQPNETLEFDGNCPNGIANGPGEERWYLNGKINQIIRGDYLNGDTVGVVRMIDYTKKYVYEGEMRGGLFDGNGRKVYEDGREFVGEWRRGSFVTNNSAPVYIPVPQQQTNPFTDLYQQLQQNEAAGMRRLQEQNQQFIRDRQLQDLCIQSRSNNALCTNR